VNDTPQAQDQAARAVAAAGTPQAEAPAASLRATLGLFDAVAIMIGAVVGIGIFKTPSLVAANVETGWAFIAVWVAGGLVTLIGALCYAELASAYPNAGGEYHFLARAFGRHVAVLFGWARGSVIQTGAIGAVAFVFGDYANTFLPLGEHGAAIHAALAILALTAVNVVGTPHGSALQNVMSALLVFTVLALIAAGFAAGPAPPAPPPQAGAAIGADAGALGMAMILVLLTYGGWNEVTYLSGELRDARRNMVRVLLIGTAALTVLYVAANAAMLWVLGLDALRDSPAVATDVMRLALGPTGAVLIGLFIALAALSTLNATIITGARVYYAAARDLSILPGIGQWSARGVAPANGLMLQAVLALALVGLGAATRSGFQAMVDYTAPVFWAFMFLVGLSLVVLRRRSPRRALPFRVPLYPLTPLLFCASCLAMLYASIVHTGVGALLGIGVVLLGTPLLFFTRTPQARDPGVQPAE
jgi:basic amino acid/polyamine antiporter, APA family